MCAYKHSVTLDESKCKGCTNCLKRCPTEAIRIRDGHAIINPARCIDCGECIRLCPYKAKKAASDSLDEIMQQYKWKIALPAPSLYGQFDNLEDIDFVLQGLLDYGFDDVFEVSRAAEIVSGYTRRYLKKSGLQHPVISSACPVVTRLISLRYPSLCDNVMNLAPPVDIAAALARKNALADHPELKSEDIGVCFISPCPGKVSYVKNGFSSGINCVVSMRDIYFALVPHMNKITNPAPLSHSGNIGVSWASTGGESTAIFNDKYLAADGIENVIRVLDEIDNGSFPEIEFVELNACSGGCVGGVMTVENPYIAKARLQTLKRYLPVSQNWEYKLDEDESYVPESYGTEPLEYIPAVPLASDRGTALRMLSDMEDIATGQLPGIDCGSCGAPSCRAFAEDVVTGEADINECVVLMRKLLGDYYRKSKGGGE